MSGTATVLLRDAAAIPPLTADKVYRIEEAPPQKASAGELTQLEFILTLILVLGGYLAVLFLGWQNVLSRHNVLEALAVVILVGAVLILGFGGDLTADNALSILAAIAGYVLGRAARGGDGTGAGTTTDDGGRPPRRGGLRGRRASDIATVGLLIAGGIALFAWFAGDGLPEIARRLTLAGAGAGAIVFLVAYIGSKRTGGSGSQRREMTANPDQETGDDL